MSELSEINPQIMVNGKLEQDDATRAEGQMSSAGLEDENVEVEDAVTAEKEAQAKVQSVFQQVRKQIRSQVGTKALKSSISELVQRVKDRETEMAQVNGVAEGKDVGSEVSEINPQIMVNGELEQDDAARAEGQTSSAGLEDEHVEVEDGVAAERETQAKVQSVFHQVRKQIRSQVGTKSSISELVRRVKDRETEMAQVNGEAEGKKEADESDDKTALKDEEMCAAFEKKLEASRRALKDEFEVQMTQVRKEMQAYTDQALKDLECRVQSWQAQNLQHLKEQQDCKGPGRTPKPSAAPSLASRRGRVLTRTMTTIVPKTCAPVIICPRAKSETLSSSKGAGSRLLPRDPGVSLPGSRFCQCRKPLPPTCPPLIQHKTPVRPKAHAGS